MKIISFRSISIRNIPWMAIFILVSCTPATAAVETVTAPVATKVLKTATPTSQPEATPTAIPRPTSTSFVPKAVIKIASHSPLSGNQALFGTDLLRGAQLAVDQLEGPLAEKGYKIELAPYNDRNNLQAATANTLDIIADPEILCSVGNLTSRITVPVSEMYHQSGLALIAPTTSSANLTEDRYREVNRLIGRYDWQGIAGAKFAKGQGFRKVYIVSEKDPYGLRNAEYFRVEADHSGIRVLGMVVLESSITVQSIVPGIIATNPELIYFAGRADQAILFFEAARAAGFMGTFLGVDDLNNPELIGRVSPSLIEGGGLYFTILNAPATFYPGAAKFIKDFDIQYGTPPLLFSARAYDAAGICIKAIEQASKAKGGEVPTRAEVIDAIRLLRNYQGITGTYTFNNQGDPVHMSYYVLKVATVDLTNWDKNSIIAVYDVTPP